MFMSLRIFLSLGAVLLCLAASTQTCSAEVIDGWTVVTRTDDLTTYSRPRKGSSVLEYKGVGLVNAAPIVVRRVIDDTAEYPNFMPYVVETKTISRTADMRVGYQRLSPPFVRLPEQPDVLLAPQPHALPVQAATHVR